MPKMKKYNKKGKSQKLYKMKGCSNKTCKNKHLGGTHKNLDIKNAFPNPGPPAGGFNFLNPLTGGCGGDQCSIPMKGGNNSLPYPNGLLGNAWTPSISGWPGVDGISMNRNHLGYNTYTNDVSRQMRDVGPAPPFTYLNGGKKNKKSKFFNDEKNNNKIQEKIITMQNKRPGMGVNKSYSPIEQLETIEPQIMKTIKVLKNKTNGVKNKTNGVKNKTNGVKKNKKGGTMSNFISQDFVNLGRQFQYGLGSTYNAIRGYAAPVNPLPWKDQLTK